MTTTANQLTNDPDALALIGLDLCPSLADLNGGPDRTDACGLALDPTSALFMCTAHDSQFRTVWPNWYASLTGPAGDVTA